MAQNSQRYFWSAEEVDQKLHQITVNIHSAAYETSKLFGQLGNYVLGATIACFLKIADSMVAHGLYA
jgi:glutamate dehydrogenase (NADP+)